MRDSFQQRQIDQATTIRASDEGCAGLKALVQALTRSAARDAFAVGAAPTRADTGVGTKGQKSAGCR